MLGSKDLGIEIQWRFEFLGPGKVVQPSVGRIYVDLGGQLVRGIIDHHFGNCNYESTTSALAGNPDLVLDHLLGPVNNTYYQGLEIRRKEMILEFVTHRFPDWDGMNSFYLTNYLIQNGRMPPVEVCTALCEAANDVDQGRVRVQDEVVRPFLLYLMMMYNGTTGEDCLLRGSSLLEQIILNSGHSISKEAFLNAFAPPANFSKEALQLQEDFSLFQNDLADSEMFEMIVPTKDSAGVLTKAFAFKSQPRCKLHKYWVREQTDAGILFVPFETDGKIKRVIISVDPLTDFVLPCFGYELEKAETKKRRILGKPRTGSPRFEQEYCDNDDPWYDGRGHGFTIVDSPRAGTVLDYAEILELARNLYSSQPVSGKNSSYDAFLSYRRKGSSDTAWALKTQLELNGKKVFLDVDSLQSGPFDSQLVDHIAGAGNFILLLTTDSLERCKNEEDWVLKEIIEAILREKNIIPVIQEGCVMPSSEHIPAKIQPLLNYNAVTLNHEYFYACVEKILRFMR